MRRLLNRTETGYFSDTFTTYCVVSFSGKVEVDYFKKGLKILQSRHPELRSYMNLKGAKPALVAHDIEQAQPIQLKVVNKRLEGYSWKSVVDAEESVDPGRSLARVFLFYDNKSEFHDVLFVLSHSLFDGKAAYMFAHHLLSVVGSMSSGEPADLQESHELVSLDDLLDPKWKGKRTAQQVPQNFAHHHLRFDDPAGTGSATKYELFDQIWLSEALDVCHAQGTTLYAMMSAACMMATSVMIAQQGGLDNVPLRYRMRCTVGLKDSLADSRNVSRLLPIVGAMYLYYTSDGDWGKETFWNFARTIKAQVTERVQRGEHLSSLLGCGRPEPEQKGSTPADFIPRSTFYHTNLGMLPSREVYGRNLRVISHYCTCTLPREIQGFISVAASSFANILSVSFIYYKTLSDEMVKRYMHLFNEAVSLARTGDFSLQDFLLGSS